jgi:hypothetical protein
MSVKTDYRKCTVTIIGDDGRVYPYLLYCRVQDANSGHNGELRLSKGDSERIHIGREAASELLPVLQKYVDTGKIVGDEYRIGGSIGGFTVCDSKGEPVIDRFYDSTQMAEEICQALNRVTKSEGESK